MGCDAAKASGLRIGLEQLPDDLFAQCGALNLVGPIHRAEDAAFDACGDGPCVDRHFDPSRHRYGAHTAVLPHKIHDAPPAIPLLYVPERERCHLRSPQAAAQQDSEDRAVAQTLLRADVRRVQERLSLSDREPVPKTDTFGWHALDARD